MKSLRESLFGDNITKEYTFGDLFKLDESSSRWKNSPLDKQFSSQRIKKATKVSGTDKCEIIYKGIVKTILDIKLDGDPEEMKKEWFFGRVERAVFDFFQWSMKVKRVYVGFLNRGALVLVRDKTLFDTDFDTVQIGLATDLNLVFTRK